MDSKSAIAKSLDCVIDSKSARIRDNVGEDTLYKIVFKNDLYTILSYSVLSRFELIKVLMDNGNSNTIELPCIDINLFMSILNKSLNVSSMHTNVIRNEITTPEFLVYNYLNTEPKINTVLNSIIADVLELITICFEKIKPESFIDNKKYIITAGDLDYYYLHKRYPRLDRVDGKATVMDIKKTKYSDIEYTYDINLYAICNNLRDNHTTNKKYVEDKKDRVPDYYTIINDACLELYKGYFSPLSSNISINYSDTCLFTGFAGFSGSIIIGITMCE